MRAQHQHPRTATGMQECRFMATKTAIGQVTEQPELSDLWDLALPGIPHQRPTPQLQLMAHAWPPIRQSRFTLVLRVWEQKYWASMVLAASCSTASATLHASTLCCHCSSHLSASAFTWMSSRWYKACSAAKSCWAI